MVSIFISNLINIKNKTALLAPFIILKGTSIVYNFIYLLEIKYFECSTF